MSKFSSLISRLRSRWLVVLTAVALAMLAVAALTGVLRNNQAALAQGSGTFNSGSDGSDGALNLTTPGTYTMTLDANGDYIYNFTTVTIGPGVTVTMKAPILNAPVYFLATGAVQIDGVIDLNGEDGHAYTVIPSNRRPSVPGAGGFGGGVNAGFGSPAQPGNGPGRGGAATSGSGGSAGHAGNGSSGGGVSGGSGGPAYGNNFLVPLLGGSGGGGSNGGGGGGAGGGALLIASSEAITISGIIQANGGGAPYSGGSGTGGGGSGGAIHLLAPRISGTGTLNAKGGATGTAGSNGRIRLDAFQQSLNSFRLFMKVQKSLDREGI